MSRYIFSLHTKRMFLPCIVEQLIHYTVLFFGLVFGTYRYTVDWVKRCTLCSHVDFDSMRLLIINISQVAKIKSIVKLLFDLSNSYWSSYLQELSEQYSQYIQNNFIHMFVNIILLILSTFSQTFS